MKVQEVTSSNSNKKELQLGQTSQTVYHVFLPSPTQHIDMDACYNVSEAPAVLWITSPELASVSGLGHLLGTIARTASNSVDPNGWSSNGPILLEKKRFVVHFACGVHVFFSLLYLCISEGFLRLHPTSSSLIRRLKIGECSIPPETQLQSGCKRNGTPFSLRTHCTIAARPLFKLRILSVCCPTRSESVCVKSVKSKF